MSINFFADCWLIIPTANRHQYLEKIFAASELTHGHIVLVRTKMGDAIPGVHNIFDLGPLNIQRWWNVGIDFAANHGAKYAAVLNDDTELPHGALRTIYHKMLIEGTSMGYAKGSQGHGMGHCFILNLADDIRPDQRFVWWYGDHDLEFQAKQLNGITIADIDIKNIHSNETTSTNAFFENIIKRDLFHFYRKYPIHFLRTIYLRLAKKWQSYFHIGKFRR